jgi:hypothetical protein
MPFSISRLLSSRETDISQRVDIGVIHILDGSIFLMNISSESPMRFPHNYVKSSVGITLINHMFMLTTFEKNVVASGVGLEEFSTPAS